MSKRRKRSKAGKHNAGLPFEVAVATIQRLLDPNCTVTHDERLIDRLGHSRQFDVVLRGRLGGHEALGVIECKDLGRPVGTPEINAFADKAQNVRANMAMIASAKGFTKPALELARFHGIGTFSLLSSELHSKGFTVGVTSFVKIFAWSRAQFHMFFHLYQPVSVGDPRDIYVCGQNLMDWFTYKLFTAHREFCSEGVVTWELMFPSPAPATVSGHPFEVNRIRLSALRVRENRSKLLLWSGKAIYDWNRQVLRLPENCAIVSSHFTTDFGDWEPFAGTVPELGSNNGSFQIQFVAFQNYELPQITVDLAEKGDFQFIGISDEQL